MAKKRDKPRKRNRKIFAIAIAAIIFAEVGWVLGTSGFRLPFFGRQQTPDLATLLANTQLWVLTQRGYAPSNSAPPAYNNSIVVITVSGISLPKSLLNSTQPVYVLMLDPFYGPYSFNAANYFYYALFGSNYTVASRYQNKIFLIMPGEQQTQATTVFQWVGEVLSMGNMTFTSTSAQQILSQLLQYLPVTVHISNGRVVSVTQGVAG